MSRPAREIPFKVKLSHKQTQAFDFLSNNEKAIELLYGGAKYGGKSYFGCVFCFQECHRLINEYGLKPSQYPIPVGFMGRKVGRDFNDTTFERWKEVVPSELYEIKGKPAQIIIADTVKIITGGFDKTEVVNKFNSAEYGLYFVDQAEELTYDEIMLLRAATFWRLMLNGRKVPGKGLLTANPRHCWLKDEFIDANS